MRGKAHTPETRASILATLLSGQKVNDVARNHSICNSVVSRYKSKFLSDNQLEDIVSKIDSDLLGNIKAYLGKGINNHKSQSLSLRNEYSEVDLQKYFISQVRNGLCLQDKPIKIIEQEVTLNAGLRLDVLILHPDQSLTICEVKSCSGTKSKARGWLLYSAIGQLLYYINIVSEEYEIPVENINLVLATDYEPDTYFYKALQMVNKSIQVINLMKNNQGVLCLEVNDTMIQ